MTDQKTQFEIDWYKPININGMESNKGYYNLCITIRDLKLWQKGLKPHRNYRLKDVKSYFGLTGSAKTMCDRLEAFRNNEL